MDAAVGIAKEIANQIRKAYVGGLEDEEEKRAMMTPEEIAQLNQEKMQRRELVQAEGYLKRAQNALKAKDGGRDEAESCFAMAQMDAEKAFQTVEKYDERVQAIKLRIDAILGRELTPLSYRKAESLRAFKELLADAKTAKVFDTFVKGGFLNVTGDSPQQRYEYVNEMRMMRSKIAQKTKSKGGAGKADYPRLLVKGIDYDKLLIEAKEGSSPRAAENEGVIGKHILSIDINVEQTRMYSASSCPAGEVLIWDVKKYPKRVLHRLPPLGYSAEEQVGAVFRPYRPGQTKYHTGPVTAVKIIDDMLVSVSLDGTLILWENIKSASPNSPPRSVHFILAEAPSSKTTQVDNASASLLSTSSKSPPSAESVGITVAALAGGGPGLAPAYDQPTYSVDPRSPQVCAKPIGLNTVVVLPIDEKNYEDFGPHEAALESFLEVARLEAKAVLRKELISTYAKKSLLFVGDESGAISVWLLMPNQFTIGKAAPPEGAPSGNIPTLASSPLPPGKKSRKKKEKKITPKPILVRTFNAQQPVTSLLLDVDSSTHRLRLFAGDKRGIITVWDISSVLVEDPGLGMKLGHEEVSGRILALTLVGDKLFAGCLGQCTYPVGLILEYGDNFTGWSRAYVVKVNEPRQPVPPPADSTSAAGAGSQDSDPQPLSASDIIAQTTYDVVVDPEYDGTGNPEENSNLVRRVPVTMLRLIKKEDPYARMKKKVKDLIFGAGSMIDRNLVALTTFPDSVAEAAGAVAAAAAPDVTVAPGDAVEGADAVRTGSEQGVNSEAQNMSKKIKRVQFSGENGIAGLDGDDNDGAWTDTTVVCGLFGMDLVMRKRKPMLTPTPQTRLFKVVYPAGASVRKTFEFSSEVVTVMSSGTIVEACPETDDVVNSTGATSVRRVRLADGRGWLSMTTPEDPPRAVLERCGEAQDEVVNTPATTSRTERPSSTYDAFTVSPVQASPTDGEDGQAAPSPTPNSAFPNVDLTPTPWLLDAAAAFAVTAAVPVITIAAATGNLPAGSPAVDSSTDGLQAASAASVDVNAGGPNSKSDAVDFVGSAANSAAFFDTDTAAAAAAQVEPISFAPNTTNPEPTSTASGQSSSVGVHEPADTSDCVDSQSNGTDSAAAVLQSVGINPAPEVEVYIEGTNSTSASTLDAISATTLVEPPSADKKTSFLRRLFSMKPKSAPVASTTPAGAVDAPDAVDACKVGEINTAGQSPSIPDADGVDPDAEFSSSDMRGEIETSAGSVSGSSPQVGLSDFVGGQVDETVVADTNTTDPINGTLQDPRNVEEDGTRIVDATVAAAPTAGENDAAAAAFLDSPGIFPASDSPAVAAIPNTSATAARRALPRLPQASTASTADQDQGDIDMVEKTAELKLFAAAAEAFLDSSLSLMDMKSNYRWTQGMTVSGLQTASTVVGGITNGLAQKAAPEWLLKKLKLGETAPYDGPMRKEPLTPTMFIWDLADLSNGPPKEPIVPLLNDHYGAVSAFYYSPDSNLLYSASYDTTICVWDLSDLIPPVVMDDSGTVIPPNDDDMDEHDKLPIKVGRITGFSGAIHTLRVYEGDRLYASTSEYDVEERMMPLEMSKEPLVELTANVPAPNVFQFELQALDDENNTIFDRENMWKVSVAAKPKSWVSAFLDLTWRSLMLSLDVYHSGRCDEKNRFVPADEAAEEGEGGKKPDAKKKKVAPPPPPVVAAPGAGADGAGAAGAAGDAADAAADALDSMEDEQSMFNSEFGDSNYDDENSEFDEDDYDEDDEEEEEQVVVVVDEPEPVPEPVGEPPKVISVPHIIVKKVKQVSYALACCFRKSSVCWRVLCCIPECVRVSAVCRHVCVGAFCFLVLAVLLLIIALAYIIYVSKVVPSKATWTLLLQQPHMEYELAGLAFLVIILVVITGVAVVCCFCAIPISALITFDEAVNVEVDDDDDIEIEITDGVEGKPDEPTIVDGGISRTIDTDATDTDTTDTGCCGRKSNIRTPPSSSSATATRNCCSKKSTFKCFSDAIVCCCERSSVCWRVCCCVPNSLRDLSLCRNLCLLLYCVLVLLLIFLALAVAYVYTVSNRLPTISQWRQVKSLIGG